MIARAVNSIGLGMIGGGSLEEALSELESGAADAVVVLENDLHRHASAARVDAALSKAPLVMVIDHQRTAIMDKAHGALCGKLRRKRWYGYQQRRPRTAFLPCL